MQGMKAKVISVVNVALGAVTPSSWKTPETPGSLAEVEMDDSLQGRVKDKYAIIHIFTHKKESIICVLLILLFSYLVYFLLIISQWIMNSGEAKAWRRKVENVPLPGSGDWINLSFSGTALFQASRQSSLSMLAVK